MLRLTLLITALLAATIAAAPPPIMPPGEPGAATPQPPPPPLSEPQPTAVPTATPTAGAAATPAAGVPATSAPVDPAMMAQAKGVLTQLQGGTIDRSMLEPTMSTALTDQQLSNFKSTVGALGAPASFVQQRAGSQGQLNYALYLVTFKDGTKLDMLYVVDKAGKIAGLRLAPPQ